MQNYMNIAKSVSLLSKDKKAKIGAVALDSKLRILGSGVNGYPSGYDDEDESNKHDKVIHAELNAIINSRVLAGDIHAMVIYGLPPCANCLKLLAAWGVQEVYYCIDYSIRSVVEWLPEFERVSKLHNIRIEHVKLD